MCSTPHRTMDVARAEGDIGTVAVADHELALAQQEKFIVLGMAMPDELALDPDDFDILAIGRGDHPRRAKRCDLRELLVQI